MPPAKLKRIGERGNMFKNYFIEVSDNLWRLSLNNFTVNLEYFKEENEYLVDVSCMYTDFNEVIIATSPKLAQFKAIKIVKDQIGEIIQDLNRIKSEI